MTRRGVVRAPGTAHVEIPPFRLGAGSAASAGMTEERAWK